MYISCAKKKSELGTIQKSKVLSYSLCASNPKTTTSCLRLSRFAVQLREMSAFVSPFVWPTVLTPEHAADQMIVYNYFYKQ